MSWLHKGDALFWDLETHSADQMWDREPRDMFRLGQYAWGMDGDIVLTEDYDEMLHVVRGARLNVGHNIHSFDHTVLFGKDSHEPLELALAKRTLDTFTWAGLSTPSPTVWTDRNGHTFTSGNKPEMASKWLALDNLAFQWKLPGKVGSLRALAVKYNPPKTKVADLDYGLIPLDDEEFREYAYGDIVALRAIARHLLEIPGGVTPYIWREQKFAGVCAQNSRNGWKVDVTKAQQRVDFLAERRERIIADVVEKYGLPTEGKAPWSTTEGKTAILAALSDFGISPDTRPDWTRTATGNISLGGEVLLAVTAGTPAEDLGVALSELKGQRSLAALALEEMKSDGKIHPSITALQRSGRLSTTRPGLTVWTSRGDGAVEKEYFITDDDEHALVSFDFSNADARIVAAYSGDTEYLKRFEPGVDAHELTGRMVWGDEVYDSDPATYRQRAKMCVHAYSYGARPKTLSFQTGLPIEVTTEFCRAMDAMYAGVVRWQRAASDEGSKGWITNDWGRRMPVDIARSFTQSSALLGQSGTREILVDGLLRLAEKDIRYILCLKAQIHDEIIMELPKKNIDKHIETVVSCLTTTWGPKIKGQKVDFILSHGEPAGNWYEASH